MLHKNTIFLLILIHVFLGYLLYQIPFFMTILSYSLLIIGLVAILLTQNQTGLAHKFACYFLSIELLTRMLHQSVFWEFGKYSICLFLLSGILVQSSRKLQGIAFTPYLFFLLPAAILTNSEGTGVIWRELISFNLSGPLTLCIAFIYFYKRPFSITDFQKCMLWTLLPLTTIATVILMKMPTLDSLIFGEGSNPRTSGEFGPNQVSTLLGLGPLLLITSKFLRLSVTQSKIMDWFFIALFFILGLLTFARGGVISTIVAVAMGYLFTAPQLNEKRKFLGIFGMLVLLLMLGWSLWKQVDTFTEGKLAKRYETMWTSSEENETPPLAGRLEILRTELQMFLDYLPWGTGVGMGQIKRIKYNERFFTAVSHTEFTRLLAEHGFPGLCSLLILLFTPLFYFLSQPSISCRIFCASFITLSFLTMSHSAMRLAMPAVLYGMSFIHLKVPLDRHELK